MVLSPVASTWGWDGHAPRQAPAACGICVSFFVSRHETRWRRSFRNRLRDISLRDFFFRNIGCAQWIPMVRWKTHCSAEPKKIPVPTTVFPYSYHGCLLPGSRLSSQRPHQGKHQGERKVAIDSFRVYRSSKIPQPHGRNKATNNHVNHTFSF